MNQTLLVLFITTALTVSTVCAETTWPQAPGLSSPVPPGATDLKPATTPPPATTEKITTLSTSEPQKAPTPAPAPTEPAATSTDNTPSVLRLDSPPPSASPSSAPLFPAPSTPLQ